MINYNIIAPLSDPEIDRIVDGLLTPAELRAAIRRLERQPDGWKRCALAFLEAQCFSAALKAEDLPQPRSLPTPAPPAKPATRHLPRRLAMVASIAASVAVGWFGHSWQDPAAPSPAVGVTVAPSQPSESWVPADRTIPVSLPQPPPKPAVREVARLVIGPENARAEVPILAGPGIDANWANNQPPPFSEHDLVTLQRNGYQVDQRRRLVTTTLPDGQHVAIPIDRVQIRFTGKETL